MRARDEREIEVVRVRACDLREGDVVLRGNRWAKVSRDAEVMEGTVYLRTHGTSLVHDVGEFDLMEVQVYKEDPGQAALRAARWDHSHPGEDDS